jgi:hypothetical protein
MRTVPVAGIDSFIIRDIAFKLRHDTNLSIVSTRTILLLQRGVDLVNHEMLIIFHEIEYWRGIAQATPFEKHITNLFHQGPTHFLSTLRAYFFDNPLLPPQQSMVSVVSTTSTSTELSQNQKDQMIDLRLSILQNKFHSLGLLLNTLHQSGATIRTILSKYQELWSGRHTIRRYSPETDESCYSIDDLSSEQFVEFRGHCHSLIENCLNLLINIFGNDTFVRGQNETRSLSAVDKISDEISQLLINDICDSAEKCVKEAEVPPPPPPLPSPPHVC